MILDEDIWKLSDFAEIVGLDPLKFRVLEEELLLELDFQMHVSPRSYNQWL